MLSRSISVSLLAVFNTMRNICRSVELCFDGPIIDACIFSATEKDTEKRYRDRFVLTDKQDYEQQEHQKVTFISILARYRWE